MFRELAVRKRVISIKKVGNHHPNLSDAEGRRTKGTVLNAIKLSENAHKARRDICREDGETGKQWADKLLHTSKHDGYEPTWQQLLEWHVGLRRGSGQRRIG